MSKLVILADGSAVQPRKVTMVRRSTTDPDKSIVFTSGQGFQDGFIVDVEFEEAVTTINRHLPDEPE